MYVAQPSRRSHGTLISITIPGLHISENEARLRTLFPIQHRLEVRLPQNNYDGLLLRPFQSNLRLRTVSILAVQRYAELFALLATINDFF